MAGFYNNSIFWIDVEKIKPNPYQPRREFDPEALQSLADSIRQYGVLQPLVVTRQEVEKEDGGLVTEYELIAGERRLRASKLAGVVEVPALIRDREESDKVKLELAIIENLQREDLNPIERAEAFAKLCEEFGFKHVEVAKKIGKSREYVSNSMRLLALPAEIKEAIQRGDITEGHARPLLMLTDRKEEQSVLFREVFLKKLTVRETEEIARRVAHDKVRRKVHEDPRLSNLEKELSETFGTRVRIEKKAVGGKVSIDFFSDDDLSGIINHLYGGEESPYSSGTLEGSYPGFKEEEPSFTSPESGVPEEGEGEFIVSTDVSEGSNLSQASLSEEGNTVNQPPQELWKKLQEMEEHFKEGERILSEDEKLTSSASDTDDEEDSIPGEESSEDKDDEEEDGDLYSFGNFTV
jgi:ParB family chromosome partitioning protein